MTPQATLELLLEMNDDVKGTFRVASPAALVRDEPAYFRDFTLVIATQLPGEVTAALAAVLEACSVPLVVVRSYGLLGYLRIYSREHTITELKSFAAVDDLRVANPFPALRAYADAIDLSSVDDMTHKHIPYVVLLIKALDAWKAAVRGRARTVTRRWHTIREVASALALLRSIPRSTAVSGRAPSPRSAPSAPPSPP